MKQISGRSARIAQKELRSDSIGVGGASLRKRTPDDNDGAPSGANAVPKRNVAMEGGGSILSF